MPTTVCLHSTTVKSPPLDVKQNGRRLLDRLFDLAQEENRFSTVDEPMIVGECYVHHRPDLDLAVDCDRSLNDRMHSKDG